METVARLDGNWRKRYPARLHWDESTLASPLLRVHSDESVVTRA